MWLPGGLRRRVDARLHQGATNLPRLPPSSGPHGGGQGRLVGPDLQLEGWGDVEKAADSWLEAQGIRWARAFQGEGLQDGGEEEEELCAGQALSQADALT